jgi:hypothetical protein
MRTYESKPLLLMWCVSLAYALSFVALVQDTSIGHIDGARGRPDIGYYFSKELALDAWCHAAYWPFGRLLELTGRWVYLPAGARPSVDWALPETRGV